MRRGNRFGAFAMAEADAPSKRNGRAGGRRKAPHNNL
jgi:hypothetical protein